MTNELMAIVGGYVEADSKKFVPTHIRITSYAETRIKYELKEARRLEREKSKESRYRFKVVKADKYPALLNSYNFTQWKNGLLEEIDFHFRDLEKEYREALKSGIRQCIIFEKVDVDEIVQLGVTDITYTTSAKESISARFRTSTWTSNVEGMLGTYRFNGSSYDVNGL